MLLLKTQGMEQYSNFFQIIFLSFSKDLYVYLSEEPYLKDFKSTQDLVWRETGIEYGNWYSGPNKDSNLDFHYSFQPSQVRYYNV